MGWTCEDPALLHTDLASWLLYFLSPEHPLLLALVLMSAEAGGSAAGCWQFACAKVTHGQDALQFLFPGCPEARELGCVFTSSSGNCRHYHSV